MFNALKSRKVFIALEKALQRKYHVMRIHCEIYLDTVFFGRFLLFFVVVVVFCLHQMYAP